MQSWLMQWQQLLLQLLQMRVRQPLLLLLLLCYLRVAEGREELLLLTCARKHPAE
jgi:hypothetical protein